MGLPETLSGFAVIPAVYSKDATHFMYAKAHMGSKKREGSSSVLLAGRTLFLVNVPPDATEREITLFFKNAGVVEKVVFDQEAAEREAQNSDSDSDDEDADADEGMKVDGEGTGGGPTKKRKRDREAKDKP
ncbi:hypothetical protein M0805_005180, partial [Coniferiporia weirii]